MNRWMNVILVTTLLPGCSEKDNSPATKNPRPNEQETVRIDKKDAVSGKDFYRKLKSAVLTQDQEGLWRLFSKRTHQKFFEIAEKELSAARNDKSMRAIMDRKFGKEAASLSVENYAKLRLLKIINPPDRSKFENSRVSKERVEGDRIIITIEVDVGDEKEITLIREDGFVRWGFFDPRNKKKE